MRTNKLKALNKNIEEMFTKPIDLKHPCKG